MVTDGSPLATAVAICCKTATPAVRWAALVVASHAAMDAGNGPAKVMEEHTKTSMLTIKGSVRDVDKMTSFVMVRWDQKCASDSCRLQKETSRTRTVRLVRKTNKLTWAAIKRESNVAPPPPPEGFPRNHVPQLPDGCSPCFIE